MLLANFKKPLGFEMSSGNQRKKFVTKTARDRFLVHKEARALGLLSRTVIDYTLPPRVVHRTRVRMGDTVCDAKHMRALGLSWYDDGLRIHVQARLEPVTWVEVGPRSAFRGGVAERVVIGTAFPSKVAQFKGWLHDGRPCVHRVRGASTERTLRSTVKELAEELHRSLQQCA